MSLAKTAQDLNFPFFSFNDDDEDSVIVDEKSDASTSAVTFQVDNGVGKGQIMVDEDGDGEFDYKKFFNFELPKIPGADVDPAEIVVDEPQDEVIEPEQRDPWDWGTVDQFPQWLSSMLQGIPKHRGELTGSLRAMAYLQTLKKSILRAVQSDLKGILPIKELDQALNKIEDGIKRLEEHTEKMQPRRKKASLVKNAQKIAGVHGIVVTVPLLISSIARVCINGTVSAGHDMEWIFDKQVEKFKLTDREQQELTQLLDDMGYPIRRDRGLKRDEVLDPRSSDNFDFAANYHA